MKKLGVIVLAGLLWGVAPATAAYADHDYGDGNGCWEGECYDDGYGGGQEYDQYNNEDRNRNRNRNRGAFSPGPFDRSPIDFSDSCISLDCSGREKKDDQKEPR